MNNSEQRLRDKIKQKSLEAQALQLKAKHLQLPTDPADWLNQCEKDTLSLPDELPQKQEILRNVDLAREAMAKSDLPEVKLRFLRIIKNHENARHDLWAGRAEKAEVEKINRERELRKRNENAQALKSEAQRKAQEKWQKDKEQQIRLGDMCEKVYRAIIDFATRSNTLDLLPGEAEGIKPWLREIAPDYAKKPGRPKKQKK
jgi:hypothetical protein